MAQSDNRRWHVETSPARIWIAKPALEPPGVTYGREPGEIALTRQELLDWLPKPPEPVKESRTVTSDLLNVRSGPGMAFPVVAKLKRGTVVIVGESQTADTYVWRKVDSAAPMWLAEQFTAPTGTIPPPPDPKPDPKPEPPPVVTPPLGTSPGVRKFGVNFVGPGSPNPVWLLQGQLQAAGKVMGPTVIVNEWKAVADVKASLIVYRVKTGSGRAEPDPFDYQGRAWTPVQWFNEWWPLLSQAQRSGLVYKFHNELEWRGKWERRIAWEREFMQLATNRGLRITYGNFAVDGLDKSALPLMIPMLDQGVRQGHILCGNTYLFGDSRAEERLGYMLPLVAQVPETPWMHGELGFGENDARYAGPDALQRLLEVHARRFEKAGVGYQGAALWCHNGIGGGWPHSNIPEDDAGIIVRAAR